MILERSKGAGGAVRSCGERISRVVPFQGESARSGGHIWSRVKYMDTQALLTNIISVFSSAMLFYERNIPNFTLG